jgi:hypothetical protein
MIIQLAPAYALVAHRAACFVTGHDFSRAESSPKEKSGFSPCGLLFQQDASLQGLKPAASKEKAIAARLKSCPVTELCPILTADVAPELT